MSLPFLNSLGDTILRNISRWNAILGIVLVIFALVLVFASTPIVLRTKWSDEKKGRAILVCKIAGMLTAVVGALLACLI